MRRSKPAGWPILCCAIILAGAAKAETVELRYDLSVSGIGVADMIVSAQIDGAAYAIRAKGETYGAAALVDDLTIDAQAAGLMRPASMTPQSFGTDNVLDGAQRHARVTWSAEGEALVQALHPTLAAEQRTPIPDEARMGALDPISALYAFARGGPATGACEGGAKVFDGRRSYTLALKPDRDGTVWVKLTIGDTGVVALKCTIESRRTGGASPASWFSSSGETEKASIWFWRDPRGRAIPVRIEADAAIGYAVGELAGLPD